MATLEQQRQSIANEMRSARTPTKRSTLEEVAARRNGIEIVNDLNKLNAKERPYEALPKVEGRGGIAAVQGLSKKQANSASSKGGGSIASPLTESAERQYYTDSGDIKYVWSSDNLVVVTIQPIKKITMTDANSNLVEFNYNV